MAETPELPSPSPEKPAEPIEPVAVIPAKRTSWAWPTAWMVSMLLLVGGAVVVLKSCYEMPVRTVEKAGGVVEQIGKTLQTVAASLRQGAIHTSFTSYATTLSTTHYLQFAKLKQMEMFTRSDERAIGYVRLPEVVVEARAPIEYTYYFDLNGIWDFVLRDNVMDV